MNIIGVLITDHNVRETLDICERAYIVNAGEIIASWEPEAILAHEQVRKVYLGDKFKLFSKGRGWFYLYLNTG